MTLYDLYGSKEKNIISEFAVKSVKMCLINGKKIK